ncbi:hypothetical protein AM349_13740 [Citrobacter freundii]|nr:hypothetical protein AM349_13740 [Citrobacter freundii]
MTSYLLAVAIHKPTECKLPMDIHRIDRYGNRISTIIDMAKFGEYRLFFGPPSLKNILRPELEDDRSFADITKR